jgi:hypothetical protein
MASSDIKNLLLAALPRNAFEALRSDLVHVDLLEGETIDVSNILAAIAAGSTIAADAGQP